MTDQELIKALRWCGDGLHGCCIGCPGENTCGAPDGGAKTVLDAADRLEALIAKNVELHEKNRPADGKWVCNAQGNPEACFRKVRT